MKPKRKNDLIELIKRETSPFGARLFQQAGVLRDYKIDILNPLDTDIVVTSKKIKPFFDNRRDVVMGFRIFGQTTEDVFFKELKDKLRKNRMKRK